LWRNRRREQGFASIVEQKLGKVRFGLRRKKYIKPERLSLPMMLIE
jgi:hypothetical protein